MSKPRGAPSGIGTSAADRGPHGDEKAGGQGPAGSWWPVQSMKLRGAPAPTRQPTTGTDPSWPSQRTPPAKPSKAQP